MISTNIEIITNNKTIASIQDCYGVKEVPSGDWFCRSCEAGIPKKDVVGGLPLVSFLCYPIDYGIPSFSISLLFSFFFLVEMLSLSQHRRCI